jgi:hypothetical protein
MRELEDALFLREELERAKKELFTVTNVRELKMLQNRISFLSQQLRAMNRRNKK